MDRLFSYLILFICARLTGGLYASIFICMDRVHFVWVFFISTDCLFVFLIFRPVVGKGVLSSVLVGFPDGLPEWGHLSKLGLGSGFSGPFGYPVCFW